MQVAITVNELAAMIDQGMSLYWTPGADRPYWAPHPAFQYDRLVAAPEDFLKASGTSWTRKDLAALPAETVLALAIEPPASRGYETA
jgi:hypothetical protein